MPLDDVDVKNGKHPLFKKIHDSSGSGYYWYTTKVGLGSIVYISSTKVIPYNAPVRRAADPHYDLWDFLRACEEGVVRQLVSNDWWMHGEKQENTDDGNNVGVVPRPSTTNPA